MTPAPAMLARRYDCSVLPAFCVREPDAGLTLLFEPPLRFEKTNDSHADLLKNTQTMAYTIEQAVRNHMEQWFWFHKRWKRHYPYLYPEDISMRQRRREKRKTKMKIKIQGIDNSVRTHRELPGNRFEYAPISRIRRINGECVFLRSRTKKWIPPRATIIIRVIDPHKQEFMLHRAQDVSVIQTGYALSNHGVHTNRYECPASARPVPAANSPSVQEEIRDEANGPYSLRPMMGRR